MSEEVYLADAVYASFDGYQIKLRTAREEGDHVIYLEPALYAALQAFADKCWPVQNKERDDDAP